MAATNVPEIILFWYDISIYSRKMDYYLTLRGLPYKRCVQPPNLPRQDLQRLGVNYRRIPILAIGRDIYCDSRLIIQKLEELFPSGSLGSQNPFEQGLESVFEAWIAEAGPFWRTAGCIPLSTPVVQDPVWMKDRFDGTGGAFTAEALVQGRSECLVHLRMYYGIAEKMLQDGRKDIFNTDEPTLGDVHAIWTFDWGINLGLHADQENVDDKLINERSYPRVFAWVERFRAAYKTAEGKRIGGAFISSDEAVRSILAADFFESEHTVDTNDPLELRQGQKVAVSPSDFGASSPDTGELLSLSVREIVITKSQATDGKAMRLPFPRKSFTIAAV